MIEFRRLRHFAQKFRSAQCPVRPAGDPTHLDRYGRSRGLAMTGSVPERLRLMAVGISMHSLGK